MNETVIQPITSFNSKSVFAEKFDGYTQNCKSIMTSIVSRLGKTLGSYRIPDNSQYKHQSFVQDNLLDKNLGPEIKRIFRWLPVLKFD